MWFLLFFPAAWLIGAIFKAPRAQNIVTGILALGAVAWLGYDISERAGPSRKTEFMIHGAMMREIERTIGSGETNRLLAALPAYYVTAGTAGPVRAALELAEALRKTNREGQGSIRESIGKPLTLVGVAEPAKMGAAVRGEDFYVWIDGLHDWTEEFSGKQVEVVGILEERHDLPVFVADTPEERGMRAGIPVPSGTDLHEASRRFVLKDAKWKLKR